MNLLAKVLFVLVTSTALAMVAVPFFQRAWRFGFNPDVTQQLLQALLDFARFMVLFSSIIPISLRVALDMAKLVYKVQMTADARMPGLQVRSSNLPEELGGIEFLLTDKTGTLTRNEMIFRKLHLGSLCVTPQSLPECQLAVANSGRPPLSPASPSADAPPPAANGVRTGGGPSTPEPKCNRHAPAFASFTSASSVSVGPAVGAPEAIYEAILAIALCHNVSPIEHSADANADSGFQGASPDELALVQFAARCGLVRRDRPRSDLAPRDRPRSHLARRCCTSARRTRSPSPSAAVGVAPSR